MTNMIIGKVINDINIVTSMNSDTTAKSECFLDIIDKSSRMKELYSLFFLPERVMNRVSSDILPDSIPHGVISHMEMNWVSSLN